MKQRANFLIEATWKDAALNSTKGLEHGKELVRKNGRFMLDYFFNMCREKDLA